MKRYWFRTKRYGWGWVPATWEGWLVLLITLVLHGANTYRFVHTLAPDSPLPVLYLGETVLLFAVLIFVCYRTGEPPRWRWGK